MQNILCQSLYSYDKVIINQTRSSEGNVHNQSYFCMYKIRPVTNVTEQVNKPNP